MPETIPQRELRNDNAEIIRRVESGESFTITRNGRPIADLIPHQRTRGRRFIPARELQELLADLPPWGVESWYAERAEVDALFDDEESDPWNPGRSKSDEDVRGIPGEQA